MEKLLKFHGNLFHTFCIWSLTTICLISQFYSRFISWLDEVPSNLNFLPITFLLLGSDENSIYHLCHESFKTYESIIFQDLEDKDHLTSADFSVGTF